MAQFISAGRDEEIRLSSFLFIISFPGMWEGDLVKRIYVHIMEQQKTSNYDIIIIFFISLLLLDIAPSSTAGGNRWVEVK